MQWFMRYTEENPVEAGLCATARDWKFSSAGDTGCGADGADCGADCGAAVPAAPSPAQQAGCLHHKGDSPHQTEIQQQKGLPVCGAAVPAASSTDQQAGSLHQKDSDQQETGSLQHKGLPLDQGGTGPQAYADAVATYLAFAVDKAANRGCTLCFWDTGAGNVQQAFGRQALPMTWDFCEANPFSDSSGSWGSHINFTAKCVGYSPPGAPGGVIQRSAAGILQGSPIISTDPPYYDNIGYADLSDFFYIWLRRSLGDVYPDLFKTVLTPKAEELIASPYRHGGKLKAQEFFETGLGKVFESMRKVQPAEYPMTVFYAFKQSEETDESVDAGEAGRMPAPQGGLAANAGPVAEGGAGSQTAHASTGWETMLAGLIRAGFAITGTWPMRTELVGNLKKNMSALASSIVLACRPRAVDAATATRREFLNALKRELPDALRHLQESNIAPVDLAQAAIGPGMAIFTRYARVMEADGYSMPVRTALGLINQLLDEVLAEQEGEFDADTRWALAWFEQFGMNEGPFGVAETLSKAKNTAVNGLVETGLIAARSGKVRLLKRGEIVVQASSLLSKPAGKMPAPQKLESQELASQEGASQWLVVQQLIRNLQSDGEQAAAGLLRQLDNAGESARDLAYRLYVICERKKWSDEALAYNALVVSWPEITKLARSEMQPQESQKEMF